MPILGHKGASVHVRALARALAAKGATVVVASPRVAPEGDRLGAPVELARIDGVLPKEHEGEASLQAAVARQTEQVVELARRHDVDAIYERHSLFGAAGVRAAALTRRPHVLEVNAPLCVEALAFRELPHPQVATALEAEAFDCTGRILAVSQTLTDLLVSAGVDRSKIEVVGNAVEPERFGDTPHRPADVFTIGFAGSLKPWHGIDVLIEAFRRAQADVPELRLEIVGHGPAARLLDDAHLSPGVVTRHGQLTHEDTLRQIARWHVGVAPFQPLEDFYFSPLKLLEYMASGLCAVASDLPELRRVLADGERGVLVEPGSAASLAESFVALARDRERASELGLRARLYALGALSWSRNADRALRALRGGARELAA